MMHIDSEKQRLGRLRISFLLTFVSSCGAEKDQVCPRLCFVDLLFYEEMALLLVQ